METNYDVIVIGGGASGMMASIFAAINGNKVLILDHNEKLGKKIYITGKGKCNLTNDSSVDNHIQNIITNSKFMYTALNSFTPVDTMKFFEDNGLKLRVERGHRVFPFSNLASDVTKTLERVMQKENVKVSLNNEISSVEKIEDKFNIKCNNGVIYTASSLIIATGGLSYSGTGSSPLGYNIAKQFGHNVIEPRSALCPIIVKENISELNGLSLKNVVGTIIVGKKVFSEIGEMMFTYNSITGPIALTMSSKINKSNLSNALFSIDLKPALDENKLDEKFKREFVEFAKKDYKNYLATLLPSSLIEYFMRYTKISNKKMADFTKIDREILIKSLKHLEFRIKSLESINVSIVTSGGVDVKEINPSTCESKLVKNLYFVGEVLDVDALTGGYNLQIAWSTGKLAGDSIKRNL